MSVIYENVMRDKSGGARLFLPVLYENTMSSCSGFEIGKYCSAWHVIEGQDCRGVSRKGEKQWQKRL
ncbi:MAG: hypothetical protein LUI87_11270 [Lachnospiraceae bacterium]|nr:hypothetical protein [Lachnospiraceae bacterium]